ncbi:LCP family protein [Fodinicola feengrottensis]|uniref:LCP family protein n=1 Tax=Fodinicola feengrottensis TaxID=435914 RepID=UPI0031DF95D3
MPTPTRSRPTGSGGGTVYTGRTVKPRRNWKRISLIGGGVAVVLILLLGGYAYARVQTLNGNITRTDPFAGLGDRPHKTVDGAQNILVVGDDNADGSRGYQGVEGQRTDAIILLHIPADHTKAYLISIPRDTYVSVPKAKNGLGGNKTKINAAYSYGGAPLLIQTVENFTDVHIDHLVVIGFAGFKTMTDALGGVDVTVDKTVTDPRSKRTFTKGVNHLDGTAALDYVRQRYGLPNSDFDRQKRAQIFLKALLKKATSTGTLTDPGKLNAFLDAATKSVTADEQFSLTDMAFQFKGLRAADISFVTMPNLGSVLIGGVSYVKSDKTKASALFSAVSNDTMADWAKTHPVNNADSGS